METEDGFDVLPRDECLALLSEAGIGRVAFSYRALPAIVPVTFGLDRDEIVIRTTRRSKLATVGEGSVVSFEVDAVEPDLHSGWSVVVTGLTHEITDSGEIEKWGQRIRPGAPGRRDIFLRVPMTIVTGRRIQPEPRASSHVWVQ